MGEEASDNKTAPEGPLVLLTTGATTNAKSYAVYAVRFDLAMRFAPANPAMADMNNHAAAGSGTADTEPPEKPLKALTAPAPVGSQSKV